MKTLLLEGSNKGVRSILLMKAGENFCTRKICCTALNFDTLSFHTITWMTSVTPLLSFHKPHPDNSCIYLSGLDFPSSITLDLNACLSTGYFLWNAFQGSHTQNVPTDFPVLFPNLIPLCVFRVGIDTTLPNQKKNKNQKTKTWAAFFTSFPVNLS